MYKSESTLGLVASVLNSVLAFFILAGSVLGIVYFNIFEPFIHHVIDTYAAPWGWTYDATVQLALPVLVIIASVWFILAAASLVLGFIGTAKLKNDDKDGGVLLIVAAALSLLSIFAFVPFVLYLVGGIMAISKKPRPVVAPAPQQPAV